MEENNKERLIFCSKKHTVFSSMESMYYKLRRAGTRGI